MTDKAVAIRQWLTKVLAEHPEMTASEWARRANVSPSTVNKAIKAGYPYITSTRTLMALGEVVDTAPPTFDRSEDERIVPNFLPVRYKVQAGHWVEVDAYSQAFVEEYSHPVSPDPRYGDWAQWLELVLGDSANLRIRDGAYAHVVDAVDMGYAPRTRDWVVVERRRAGGHLRERTVKQVEVGPDMTVLLWPRSTNPKWSEPINMTHGSSEGEDIEAEIVGLVIGVYDPL